MLYHKILDQLLYTGNAAVAFIRLAQPNYEITVLVQHVAEYFNSSMWCEA